MSEIPILTLVSVGVFTKEANSTDLATYLLHCLNISRFWPKPCKMFKNTSYFAMRHFETQDRRANQRQNFIWRRLMLSTHFQFKFYFISASGVCLNIGWFSLLVVYNKVSKVCKTEGSWITRPEFGA